MRAAWPKLEHVFSVRRSDEEVCGEGSPEPGHLLKEPHWLPNALLNEFPVDLLAIKQVPATLPPLNFERKSWEKLISRTAPAKQPRAVIKAWPPNAQLYSHPVA
jgi:hypothetical protein